MPTKGKAGYTTVMLRNLPNNTDTKRLLEVISVGIHMKREAVPFSFEEDQSPSTFNCFREALPNEYSIAANDVSFVLPATWIPGSGPVGNDGEASARVFRSKPNQYRPAKGNREIRKKKSQDSPRLGAPTAGESFGAPDSQHHPFPPSKTAQHAN